MTVALFAIALGAYAGNYNLRGVFLVVDESGSPLSGVKVYCQIDNGAWKSIGSTMGKTTLLGTGYAKKGTTVNFIQYQPCFPEGGQWVIKPGYAEAKESTGMRPYKNGSGKDAEYFSKMVMYKVAKSPSSPSSSSKRSDNRSGFHCMDCDTKLVSFRKWEYYCPRCREGRCDRCNSTFRPVYMVAHGHRLMKDNSVWCKCGQ